MTFSLTLSLSLSSPRSTIAFPRRLPLSPVEVASFPNPSGSATSDHHHHRRRRRPSPITMSSSDAARSTSPANQSELGELNGETDFETIVSPDGRISICGFGSLLSERSARSTFPDLINFRVARLNGFRRLFAHAAPIFFERGIAKPETKEISSLSVEPCEGESLIVTVFEISKSDIPAYLERELEFRFLAVLPETLDGKPFDNLAVLCARYSDEEFFRIRCNGSKDIYFQLYGRYGIDKIWRDDILPCRAYLRHCVLAAKNLSDASYNNFLDHTFLGDRKTTIREYLATTGSGIMEEEPPESLKSRYGG
ncbi:Butirosin biosynthesis [Trema orientale]|uniref:Butirosin biosynthesis n=1 Tax=Trema orientale TaxID=63057 RepID=A0A2P5ERR0_TREOI|nr:Butirosin biosynthesis [Trema orientale]